MTQEYWDFVRNAKAGAAIVYHTGESLHGRTEDELWPLRKGYNDGMIDFTQRRLDHGKGKKQAGSRFEYIATKRKRIRKPAPAFAKDMPSTEVHLFKRGK